MGMSDFTGFYNFRPFNSSPKALSLLHQSKRRGFIKASHPLLQVENHSTWGKKQARCLYATLGEVQAYLQAQTNQTIAWLNHNSALRP